MYAINKYIYIYMNLDICMYVGMCVCILSINTEKLWILQELKEKAQMSLSIKMPDSPGLFAVVFSQIFFKSSSFRTHACAPSGGLELDLSPEKRFETPRLSCRQGCFSAFRRNQTRK